MIQSPDDSANVPSEPFQADASDVMRNRLSRFIQTQLITAQRQLARRGISRHDGIHEARKCIRRAKAALAIGRREFGASGKRINNELGRICRGLSLLRDAQALVEVLQRLRDGASGPMQDVLLEAEAAARLRRDRLLEKALARDPHLESRRLRLLHVSERLRRLNWEAVGAEVVLTAVRRSERRLKKAGKHVQKNMADNASWHDYRRRLRRLRQQDTLLSALDIDSGLADREFRAKADALGDAQDDVLLIRRCGKDSPFRPEHRRLLRAVARDRLQHSRGEWTPAY